MSEFIEAYLSSCKACAVEERQLVIDAIPTGAKVLEGSKVEFVLDGSSLELFGNRVTNSDLQAIASAVRVSGLAVEKLDLRYNHLDDHAIESLLDILLHGQLCHLDVTSNSFTSLGIQKILSALETEPNSLTHLVVNSNELGPETGMYLAKLLRQNSKLQHIDFGGTEQNTDSLIAICSAMRENTTVRYLNFDNPRFFSHDDETTVHISNMIKDNNTLRGISLAKHSITCRGAEILSDALLHNRSIKVVNLAQNDICVEGAQALSRVILSQNNQLQSLDLRGNRVANDGATALGDGLEFSKCLAHLDLSHNEIRGPGLSAIARGLSRNASITSLKLWGNDFDLASSKLFYSLYTGRFTHHKVDLDFEPYIPSHRFSSARDGEVFEEKSYLEDIHIARNE
uniref:Uncharacterized protein n=1 Tax=Mucochytrium quahogii TaxID=96639 RepID=A0A7S2RT31_9STRA|mmetsp:Transcript_18814/g.31556  ORF Transcript_18814/g.31556 Transcript_18814/m.31556 type:complete len:399 (-) Transcript_18814:33-1229(-)